MPGDAVAVAMSDAAQRLVENDNIAIVALTLGLLLTASTSVTGWWLYIRANKERLISQERWLTSTAQLAAATDGIGRSLSLMAEADKITTAQLHHIQELVNRIDTVMGISFGKGHA
ncbi:MAG: hypothetical protein GY941_15745 [Planctomycetes bacterium]|nr:hypothetical protein [Planctomycetota bacterium]